MEQRIGSSGVARGEFINEYKIPGKSPGRQR
jgi:hypothetical protein